MYLPRYSQTVPSNYTQELLTTPVLLKLRYASVLVPGVYKSQATTFYMMVPNTSSIIIAVLIFLTYEIAYHTHRAESAMWNLFLQPKIWKRLTDLWTPALRDHQEENIGAFKAINTLSVFCCITY